MSAEAGRIAVSLKRTDFTLDADISLPSQGITGVLGASGCGKTSLLRCVAGLESSARGIVRVNGETWQGPDGFLPAWKRSVGYVFQDARLFPHLTVSQNIEYGRRRAAPLPGQGSYDDIVALLGIAHLLNRRPVTLSAGEGQRVAIARALLRYPSVILMDEPLANLDDARRQEIMPFLDRLHASLRIPMLYVSHSVDEIARLCDQLVVMQSGKVVGQGRLQDMLTRADLPGLGGKEASVVLDARVRHYDAEFELCSFAIDPAGTEVVVPGWHGEVGSPVRLRVMAADVSVCLERPAQSSILNILEAVVVAVRPEPGGYVLVSLRIGEAAMLARITSRSAQRLGLAPGSQLFAQIKGVAVRNPAG